MDAVNPRPFPGLVALAASALLAAKTPAHRMLGRYFRGPAAEIQAGAFAGIDTLGDWTAQRERRREELRETPGLSPLPARSALKPTVTGRLKHAGTPYRPVPSGGNPSPSDSFPATLP